MKNVLTHIFVTLGVIFFTLIIIGVYFFVTDPYNLKPLIFGTGAVTIPSQTAPKDTSASAPESEAKSATAAAPDNTTLGGFQLSAAQKQALVSLGIDPAAVPSTINSEQETCFVAVLGASRVGEIKAGAVPNALEFAKAKSCI